MRANTPTRRSSRGRWAVFALLSCLVANVLVAQQELANLKSRADAAEGSDRIKLALEVSRDELEYANKLYTDGDVEKAEAT